MIRETKDTVRVYLQEYLFFHRLLESHFLWILAEKSTVIGPLGGGLTVLQEPTSTVLLALPK